MRVTTLLVASILLFMVGSTEGRTTRTQHAPRPLSAADVEHGLKSAVPNARMAALVKQYGVDFELTHAVEDGASKCGSERQSYSPDQPFAIPRSGQTRKAGWTYGR